MDLKEIMAISGKPGLYKMIAQTKTGMVVESLLDGKRFTAFAHERISSLEEISIYTEDEDMTLYDVFKAIFEKEGGKASIDHKAPGNELKAYLLEFVPNYDQERVYKSDIKKIIMWYNILADNEMLEFTEEEEEAEDVDEVKEGEKKPDIEKDKEKDTETKEND